MRFKKTRKICHDIGDILCKTLLNIMLVLLINKRKQNLGKTNNMNDKICGISSKERVLRNKRITKLLGSISEYIRATGKLNKSIL